jgi:hypothetical protein
VNSPVSLFLREWSAFSKIVKSIGMIEKSYSLQ